MTDTFLGHPKGLMVCFLTELWERFAYYGMLSLLILYLTKTYLVSDAEGNRVVAAYGALIWMVPVLGGMVADRLLGSRKAVAMGCLLMSVGFITVSFPDAVTALLGMSGGEDGTPPKDVLFFSMGIIIAGIGFLKSNIATVVGSLYSETDSRRESGFTIFYWGINVGGAVGPIVCGGIGHAWGMRYGFSAAGIGMIIALITFLLGQRYIREHTEPPDPEALKRRLLGFITVERAIYIAGLGTVIVFWQLLRFHGIVSDLLLWFGAALGLYIIWFSFRDCEAVERRHMLVVLVMLMFLIVFSAMNMQMFGSLILFGDRYVDRVVFGFEIAASQLQSIPAIVVVIFAPLYAWLWTTLDRRGRNPSIPMKFTIGLILNGLAFLMPALAVWLLGSSELVPLVWLALVFIIMTLGEICIFPTGMSLITSLCPKRVVGLMMGAFYFTLSLGSIFGGELAARYTSVETADGAPVAFADGLGAYVTAFSIFGALGLGAGIVMLLAAPLLSRLIRTEDAGTAAA